VFARSAHDELILGHGSSVPETAYFEQAFASWRIGTPSSHG